MFNFRDKDFCIESDHCANGECDRHLVQLRGNYRDLPVSWSKCKRLTPGVVQGKFNPETGEWDPDAKTEIPPCGFQEVTTALKPGDTVVYRNGEISGEFIVSKCKKTVCWLVRWDPHALVSPGVPRRQGVWVLSKNVPYYALTKTGQVAQPPIIECYT